MIKRIAVPSTLYFDIEIDNQDRTITNMDAKIYAHHKLIKENQGVINLSLFGANKASLENAVIQIDIDCENPYEKIKVIR